MPTSAKPFALALTALILIRPGALAAETWQLMSRHGECAPIRSLERKLPDIGAVADPDAFVVFARAKGLAVSAREIGDDGARAVEVLIPARELSLVFVTSATCKNMQER